MKRLGNSKSFFYLYYVIKREIVMKIKEFYCEAYPTDELGVEINENATFAGLVTELFGGHDVYKYIGVGDSIIRERCFEELAKQLNKSYDFVYDMWLNS